MFNPLNFKVTIIFLSAAGMMTLNTGIVMILMMVEIKSIFSSDTFKDLSEKKTTQIMVAGLIAGVIVDLPVEICWFTDSFTNGSSGLKFFVLYNVVMFSVLFISLTVFSIRLIRKLNERQTSIGSI